MPTDDDDDRDPILPPDNGGLSPGVAVRLSELTGQKRELKRDLKAASARIAELEGLVAQRDQAIKGFEPQTTELETLRGEKARWGEERGLLAAGVTSEEDQAVARALHQRLPEKDRPALGDWLGSLKKDPSKAPKALGHLFGGGGGAGGDAGGAGGGAADGAGAGNADTRGGQRADGQSGSGHPVSAESIKAIRERALKTGDWSEWKKVRDQAYAG